MLKKKKIILLKINQKLNSIFIKISILIILFYIDFSVLKINNFYSLNELYWKNERIDINKTKKEISFYENFIGCYNKKVFLSEFKNPKISLIVPVYNQEKYLVPFYCSIQNQSLYNIEIIFVDDASTDNSSKIIKNFNKEDKRIIYLNNDINKRTYYSRKKGVLKAKGEYLLLIDPDDLLVNNILEKLYKTAKFNNLDILQYYIIYGNYTHNKLWNKLKCKSGIIYYPRVKDIFYKCRTRNLCDKLVKREIFIKSIKYIGEKYDYDRFEINDDDFALYGLIKVAKSYGFLEQIGYFYNTYNPNSTIHHIFNKKNTNKIFHSLFTIMKFYFEKSKNNRREKKLIAFTYFYEKVYLLFKKRIKYLTNGFDYIKKIIEQYINCKYLKYEDKNYLKIFLKEVEKTKIYKKSYNKKNL